MQRKTAVEIGVYEGVTTAILASNMAADGSLYAVDPFFPGRVGICWARQIALREVSRSAATARVHWIRDLSHNAVKQISTDFDFIFLDGDHSLGGITRDWNDWAPRVIAGGIFALHDTRIPAHDPTVAGLGSYQYFESHIRSDARFELVEQIDSLSILRKRA